MWRKEPWDRRWMKPASGDKSWKKLSNYLDWLIYCSLLGLERASKQHLSKTPCVRPRLWFDEHLFPKKNAQLQNYFWSEETKKKKINDGVECGVEGLCWDWMIGCRHCWLTLSGRRKGPWMPLQHEFSLLPVLCCLIQRDCQRKGLWWRVKMGNHAYLWTPTGEHFILKPLFVAAEIVNVDLCFVSHIPPWILLIACQLCWFCLFYSKIYI